MRSLKLFCLIVLPLAFNFSCKDEQSKPENVPIDPLEIQSLVNGFQPFFDNVNARKEAPELISYELVADRATGKITLLNFQEESFFPIFGEEEMGRLKGDTKYTVECTKGGKTTTHECSGKISCGRKIAACLEAGGCATICKSPKSFNDIRATDISFLKSYGFNNTALNYIKSLPQLDLVDAKSHGNLSSIKFYHMVY